MGELIPFDSAARADDDLKNHVRRIMTAFCLRRAGFARRLGCSSAALKHWLEGEGPAPALARERFAAYMTLGRQATALQDIGDVLRALREERGWNQRQFSAIAGLDRSTVARVESGANVYIRTLERAAAGFGVPLAKLYAGGPASPADNLNPTA